MWKTRLSNEGIIVTVCETILEPVLKTQNVQAEFF